MPTEVIMPKVDMDMAAGTLSVWHVGDGGTVEAGAPLFDIETDKAAMEVEAPASGRLMQVVAAGAEVPIGQAVGWIFAQDEPRTAPIGAKTHPAINGPSPRAEDHSARIETASPRALDPPLLLRAADAAADDLSPGTGPDAPGPALPADRSGQPDRPRATPAARKAASEAGIALADLIGTGPRGRVQLADVLAASKTAEGPVAVADPETNAIQAGPVDPADRTAAAVRAGVTQTPLAEPKEARAAPRAIQPEDAAGSTTLRRSGDGDGTPFLFLHGFAADAGIWSALEPRLPHGHPALTLELPSHGRAGAAQIDGFAALAAHMRRAWDALDLDAVHLVGHSLGGALALALADTRPRQIASLTLLCPAGLGPDINGPVLDGICRASRPDSLAPWLRQLVADPETLSWGYVRAAAAARADAELRAAQAQLASVLFPDGTQAFDLTAALQRVSCPTRLIWGKRDAIIPWRHALAAPGRVALHLFDGVGHLPQIEARDEIAGLLAEFP